MVEFASGAKRDELKPRYDLIPAIALRRLAQRYTLGAAKYGEYNWQKGMPFEDTFNHIIDHLLNYKESLTSTDPWDDDDLAGAMWGIATLMCFAQRHRNEAMHGKQIQHADPGPHFDGQSGEGLGVGSADEERLRTQLFQREPSAAPGDPERSVQGREEPPGAFVPTQAQAGFINGHREWCHAQTLGAHTCNCEASSWL